VGVFAKTFSGMALNFKVQCFLYVDFNIKIAINGPLRAKKTLVNCELNAP
jgi:hypothetical protein